MSSLGKLLAIILEWPKDIKVPRVTIQTEAGGLTAEEVEQRITVPIESAMNGLTGVTKIRSSSGGGLSFVWVDFDWASDPDAARFHVFERLGQVRDALPQEAIPMRPASTCSSGWGRCATRCRRKPNRRSPPSSPSRVKS